MPIRRKGYVAHSIRLPLDVDRMLRALAAREARRTGRDPRRCGTAVIVQAITMAHQSMAD